MIAAFLNIRIKQFNRAMSGLGLFRVVFLLGLLGFAGFVIFMLSSEETNSYYVSGGLVLILITLQLNRRDQAFLKTHFDTYKRLFLVEYALIAFPIALVLSIHSQWIPLLLLVASTGIITQLDYKPKQRSTNSLLQRLIPPASFEWKSGIRRSLFFIVPLWFIGLGTSFFTGSVPIVVFILGIIPISFYENGEPIQMITVYEKNTHQFLWLKIKLQLQVFSAITLPLIGAFIIFHIEYWYIPVIEYLVFISLHIFLILTKYTFYQPNSKSAAASIFGAIGAIASIMAIFLPIVWLLSIRFYLKSVKNLNFYLDDYN
ncbi:MAG: hypothetical protein WC341_05480 [Bacteroidales bacterium]|jgi:hypothetical protein